MYFSLRQDFLQNTGNSYDLKKHSNLIYAHVHAYTCTIKDNNRVLHRIVFNNQKWLMSLLLAGTFYTNRFVNTNHTVGVTYIKY